MNCYKLLIAYDGTAYSGWQIQPNAPSIQEFIQNALNIFFHRQDLYITGSGRTDQGVHAKGQVAHFKIDEEINIGRTLYALNGMLPKDIRIINIEKASPHFHAQYSAIGKEYHYHIYLDAVMDPFRRLYCWHLYRKLNIDLLQQATQLFVGTHNFRSFANEAHSGSASKNPVRTIYRIQIVPEEGGIRLEFEGNGFLYKMVRNIVGTSIDVAAGKRPLEDIELIFQSKDRRKASLAAPPHGLFLMKVLY